MIETPLEVGIATVWDQFIVSVTAFVLGLSKYWSRRPYISDWNNAAVDNYWSAIGVNRHVPKIEI